MGPDIVDGDVYSLAVAAHICIELHSTKVLSPGSISASRLSEAGPLPHRLSHDSRCYSWHSQAVHEFVTEEYRIIESLNFEFVT